MLAHGLQTETGILVLHLESDSPAWRAWVREGDIVVGFGDRTVSSVDDLHRLLTEAQIGAAAALRVLRRGKPESLEVTPGESPAHD